MADSLETLWPIEGYGDISDSNTLDAKHINDASDALQNFVNRKINRKELAPSVDFEENDIDPYEKKGWVNSSRIYRPEFYGSPSPRMMAVSGQTHFREVPNDYSSGAMFNADVNGSSSTPVPNTAARVKLKHNATINIMASFYMFEVGGVALSAHENNVDQLPYYGGSGSHVSSPDPDENAHRGYESLRAGDCYLRIDGSDALSSRRRIYVSSVGPRVNVEYATGGAPHEYIYTQRGFIFNPMIGRHQHHILYQTRLSPGIHDIGLSFRPQSIHSLTEYTDYPLLDYYWSNPVMSEAHDRGGVEGRPGFPKIKHIFFLARNFIVDVYYEDNF